MIDPTLQEKMLDAPLIIKGFVDDEPECNYELYLTELINHSRLFMQKSKGEMFRWEEKQAHGECDAVSKNYSIDYKLFATRSSLQGLRETSGSITKIAGGGIAFGVGRWPIGKTFTGVRTVAAIRKYSIDVFCKSKFRNFADKNGESCISVLEKIADCPAALPRHCRNSTADMLLS